MLPHKGNDVNDKNNICHRSKWLMCWSTRTIAKAKVSTYFDCSSLHRVVFSMHLSERKTPNNNKMANICIRYPVLYWTIKGGPSIFLWLSESSTELHQHTLSFRINCFPHVSHMKSRISVWVSSCRVSLCCDLNTLSHWLHGNGPEVGWQAPTCFRTINHVINVFGHYKQ